MDVPRVRELCTDVQLDLVEGLGPFIELTDTNHELYAHLPDYLAKNGGRGLKKSSEESLEVMHKV